MGLYIWRAGASQPSRTTGNDLLYNGTAHILHLRMRRIYVKRLRGMCTVCPLSEFEARRHHGCLSRCGERRRVGVQAPTLEIHRKQRLPTDTAEETETRLGACTRISHTCIYIQCFYFPRSVIIDSVLLFSCMEKINKSGYVVCK